jgi:hypothetical protein
MSFLTITELDSYGQINEYNIINKHIVPRMEGSWVRKFQGMFTQEKQEKKFNSSAQDQMFSTLVTLDVN